MSRSDTDKESTMKKMILAAAAVVAIVMTAAPSFAEGLQTQSANIQAGGQALPGASSRRASKSE
jgi:hypothetical protein